MFQSFPVDTSSPSLFKTSLRKYLGHQGNHYNLESIVYNHQEITYNHEGIVYNHQGSIYNHVVITYNLKGSVCNHEVITYNLEVGVCTHVKIAYTPVGTCYTHPNWRYLISAYKANPSACIIAERPPCYCHEKRYI